MFETPLSIRAAALLALAIGAWGAMSACQAPGEGAPPAELRRTRPPPGSGTPSVRMTVVVFRAVPEGGGLSAMDPDGRNRRKASEKEAQAYEKARQDWWSRASSFQATDITWSRDGQRVAFLRRPGILFVADADGRHEQRLDHDARSPVFLPGGKVIFAEGLPGTSIYVMDADGSNRKLFCEPRLPGGVWEIAAISPEGDQVLYRKYERTNLYRLDLKTRAELDLGPGLDPVWIEISGPEKRKED
ncbi:MAG: hypothetical protein HY293_12995 [Planctomycetes bacterium]|nr:hypothetical protein [Planctomycetota bacterium]